MSSLSGTQFGAGDAPMKPAANAAAPAAGEAPPGPTDTELMRAARDGDRAAFGQIVVRHQDRLFTAILRMVGDHDDARELTQEAFTRALMNLSNFRGEAGPYTWLFRIAMNLAISRLRRGGRARTFSLDAPLGSNGARPGRAGADQATGLIDRVDRDRSASQDPAVEAERREQRQQVLAALGRLDAEYRAILVMRDIEGFDYQQMADLLDVPLGTLKSRLFRARLALRDELKRYMR